MGGGRRDSRKWDSKGGGKQEKSETFGYIA